MFAHYHNSDIPQPVVAVPLRPLTEVPAQPTAIPMTVMDHVYTGFGFAAIALPLVLAIGLDHWQKRRSDRLANQSPDWMQQRDKLERIWSRSAKDCDRLNQQRESLERIWRMGAKK